MDGHGIGNGAIQVKYQPFYAWPYFKLFDHIQQSFFK
jgi:hypothetical protein